MTSGLVSFTPVLLKLPRLFILLPVTNFVTWFCYLYLTSHAAQTTSTSVQHTRESLAKFVETHARAFVTTHSTRGVWPWYRDNWRGDPPTVCGGPASSQAAPSALSACHRHSAPGPLGLCAGPFIQSSSPSQSACAMVRDVGPSAHDTGHKALMPGVTTLCPVSLRGPNRAY